jgi:DNA-binding response OmpR family regulator
VLDDLLSATIVVLADDLMWSTRLVESVRRAGAEAVCLRSTGDLEVALAADEVGDQPAVRGAIVDLAGRRYDGVAAIGHVHAARLPVIAVAQHDDQVTRRRALHAGATRVFSYDKFFRDGTRIVGAWLAADGDTQ